MLVVKCTKVQFILILDYFINCRFYQIIYFQTYINDFFHGSGEYLPSAWLADFSHRPSWCDANMALQQIKRASIFF